MSELCEVPFDHREAEVSEGQVSDVERLDREYAAGFKWLLVFDVVGGVALALWMFS